MLRPSGWNRRADMQPAPPLFSITILRRAFMPSEQIDPPAKTPSDVGQ
jgi:hypothetical protein